MMHLMCAAVAEVGLKAMDVPARGSCAPHACAAPEDGPPLWCRSMSHAGMRVDEDVQRLLAYRAQDAQRLLANLILRMPDGRTIETHLLEAACAELMLHDDPGELPAASAYTSAPGVRQARVRATSSPPCAPLPSTSTSTILPPARRVCGTRRQGWSRAVRLWVSTSVSYNSVMMRSSGFRSRRGWWRVTRGPWWAGSSRRECPRTMCASSSVRASRPITSLISSSEDC